MRKFFRDEENPFDYINDASPAPSINVSEYRDEVKEPEPNVETSGKIIRNIDEASRRMDTAGTGTVKVGKDENTGGINRSEASTDIVFWAGSTQENRANAPFQVKANGDMIVGDIAGKYISFNGSDLVVNGKVLTQPIYHIFDKNDFANQYFTSVCDESNDYIYMILASAAAVITIQRYKKVGGNLISDNGSTTNAYWFETVTYEFGQSGAIIGEYLYIWCRLSGTGNYRLIRITLSDGSLAEMSFSGTSPDNDEQNSVGTDGTNLYIGDVGTTTLRKYTVSGTTATYSSAITLPDLLASIYGNNIASNGTNIWFITDSSGNTVDNCLYKTDMSGATVSSKILYELDSTRQPRSLFIYRYMVYLLQDVTLGSSSGNNRLIKAIEDL